MKQSAAYICRLTEGGDLYLGGEIPEYERPELYPHYLHRDSVLRVVALPGVKIPANAFAGYPNLRVAELSEAVAIAPRAFLGCQMLTAVQLSPRTVKLGKSAFADCPRLFCIDYVGPRAGLTALLDEVALPTECRVLRTLPDAAEAVAGGKIGTADWSLDANGVLTVSGGAVPGLEAHEHTPWHAHLARIRHLVIGEGVTRVGERVFSAMPALTSLSVVGNTEIADFALASCNGLTEIDFFAAVTQLGTCSLAGVGARELMLPPSLRVIPEGLLQSAYALKTLVLPILPTRAEGSFLEYCEALSTVKVLSPDTDRRGIAKGLFIPKRAKVVCADPAETRPEGVDDLFRDVERAIHTAAASYTAAREATCAARALIPRLTPRIDEAEADYVALERARFAPDGTVDTTLEAIPYKKRKKILKEREADRKEALKTAESKADRSAAKLNRDFDAFFAAMKAAADACKREEKDLETVNARIAAAEERIDGFYPLDEIYRARAAALREGLDAFGEAMPTDIVPNAVMAVSEYKMLIGYRRYDDLRASCERAVLLLDEYRTEPAAEASAERRVPPCILVAGGDPVDDRSATACIAALRRAGAIVERASDGENIKSDRSYDALVLCDGGEEAAYGGFAHGLKINDRRARRDSKLFSAFFLYGKPIMGIGRGAQQINLYLAGTMRWGLTETERETHAAKDGKPRAHSITVTPDNALSVAYGLGDIPLRVLSDHGAAIRTLGRELVPIAKAHDGVIEAFVHRRVPLIGVQFALDRMVSGRPDGFVYPAPAVDDGMPLFSAFVDLAFRVREKPPVEGSEDRYSKPSGIGR